MEHIVGKSNFGIAKLELKLESQKKNGGENRAKAVMAENAPKVLEDLKPKIQEDLQTPVTEKTISWYTINTNEIKKQREKNHEKFLEVDEKQINLRAPIRPAGSSQQKEWKPGTMK